MNDRLSVCFSLSTFKHKAQLEVYIDQGLLHRWTSQLDFGITAGGLERAVSVQNST